VARLAQAGRQVDESRGDHQALGVDHAFGLGNLFGDFPIGNEDLAGAVLTARRVDHPRVLDVQAH
jgi:hypothetical protein